MNVDLETDAPEGKSSARVSIGGAVRQVLQIAL